MKTLPTIVHLTASSFFGAPERQMLELGCELSGNYRSLYISFDEEGRCGEFIQEARRQGFSAFGLKRDFPNLPGAVRELATLLREVSVSLLCPHGYKANLLALAIARWMRVPVVSVSHGWTGESLAVKVYERLDRIALRWMNEVVCVSEGQAAKVKRAGVPERNIRVICDAVRTERFANPEPEFRRRLESLFPDKPQVIVGAAGRLSPEKGFRFLVDAAVEVLREHPETGFVLFGDGPLRDGLAARIDAKGLSRRFVLPGFARDLDQCYPHFDLFVLPSFTEGLPNVVLEAYAAGVPVVATAVGGTPEIIQNGVNGYLVPPGEPAPLAQRISQLVASPASRRTMGARGHCRVEEQFSFASQAEAYRKLFARHIPSEKPMTNAPVGAYRGQSPLRPSKLSRRRRLPIRICFMIDNLTRAGVETQLVRIISQLDRSRIDPCLCILARRTDSAAGFLPDDCPVFWLGLTSMRRPSAILHAWRLASFLRRNRIDVLHVDLPGSTLFGIPVGWLARVPYLVRTRRDMGYWMSRIDRWTGRLYSRLVDMTITNCRACRESVIEVERARPESITILKNDVALTQFREIPTYSGEPVNGKPRVIGMIANLRSQKAPEVLVDAAHRVLERYPDAVFRIAGEGDLRAGLERRIEARGLSGRFELPGHVVDVPGFLSQLDVAVLCSNTEGLPNVLVEYMAAGRPVVATRVGGNEELIDNGVHGLLVPPQDAESLAAAIDRLLTDRPWAAQLAAAGRARVTSQYGGPNIARRFESLVLRMMEMPECIDNCPESGMAG